VNFKEIWEFQKRFIIKAKSGCALDNLALQVVPQMGWLLSTVPEAFR
jgi:hypothetical protein